MLEYMKRVLEFDEELSVDERNLLSVAYKNCVGSKRTSWRILDTLEKKENVKKSETNQKNLEHIQNFKKKVEGELSKICYEIIDTLDKKLIPKSKDASSKVFYLKMMGDYYRYIAEYTQGSDKDDTVP